MKIFWQHALAFVALFIASPCLAAVSVGDTPSLHFKAFGSKDTIDLQSLKGKIVVVDFWATWCGPCMAEAPHMLSVNQKYADKGLQFIGISLDSDPSALTATIKAKGFTWPMIYEGKGWQGSLPKLWGVNGIPATFLIGPDGSVLWTGHPANIDAALEDAFKNHPPQLIDPKDLAAAMTALDQMDSALSANDPAKAIKLLSSIPTAARADGKVADRITAATGKLQDYGSAELAKVQPMIDAKNFAEGRAKLLDLSQAFGSMPVGVQAKQQLAALGANPEAKAQADAEKSARASADALVVAKHFQTNKQDEQAYNKFKEIVKLYPATPAFAEASDAVAKYERDPNFLNGLKEKAAAGKAKAAISLAESYKAAGNSELAKKKYQSVIDQFPNTKWADLAREAMKGLD